MKKYNIGHALIMTFFSPAFYRDAGLFWKGTGFAYLLLLLVICWIPPLIKYQRAVSDYIENKAPGIISQIPQIKIIDGQTQVDGTGPHEIADPDSGETLALIDTNADDDLIDTSDAHVILTGSELIIKKNDIETRSFSLQNIHQFSVDQQKVTDWLSLFRKFSAMVFFPLALIGSYLFRIVQLLIYAVIGLLFARFRRTNCSYLTLVRLSVMAITPVIIANTFIGIAEIKVPMLSLFNFIVTMAYLHMGVKSISQNFDEDESQILQDQNSISGKTNPAE